MTEHLEFFGQTVEIGILLSISHKMGKFEEVGKNLDKRLTALEKLVFNFIKGTTTKRRRK